MHRLRPLPSCPACLPTLQDRANFISKYERAEKALAEVLKKQGIKVKETGMCKTS